MSRIIETIKFNNLDVNLKISLGESINITGSQQEINNVLETTKQSLINPINDVEVRRFSYDSSIIPANLQFYFNKPSGEYSCNFIDAGFSNDEINSTSLRILNSFFIQELYNSSDPNTQSKISTTYLTKILNTTHQFPRYIIGGENKNQFYYLNIPQNFINGQINNIVDVYCKYSFYSAKDGSISLFYNKQNADNPALNTTPEKMCFKIRLNLSKMTWSYIISNIYTPFSQYSTYGGYVNNYAGLTNIVAYELPTNSLYVTRINNTVNIFEDKQQNYPIGNTFIDFSGSYTTE